MQPHQKYGLCAEFSFHVLTGFLSYNIMNFFNFLSILTIKFLNFNNTVTRWFKTRFVTLYEIVNQHKNKW